jgi:thiamine-phosphate pyrophosphorylase
VKQSSVVGRQSSGLLYYITDRSQFPGDESSRRRRLLENIAQAVRCGVDYVQLREKDLSARELEMLTRKVMAIIHELRTGNKELKTGLLINSRADIALACGADGVHLRSDDISPVELRKIWAQCGAGAPARATVGVSCHTPAEVARAVAQGANFAVFGPVFEKQSAQPTGLDGLRQACQEKIPVVALGGITVENAESCLQAGAAGIAGIRLFQENEISRVVQAIAGRKSLATNAQLTTED